MSTHLAPVKFAKYEFHIRSFHPEKTFGWSGLEFSGDSRRFSLQPNSKDTTTSRIWHTFTLDTSDGSVLNQDTGSHASHAAWSDQPFIYNDIDLKPVATIYKILPRSTARGRKVLRVPGRYYGSNHAMPGSAALQETIGTTYVPNINVQYELFVTIDPTVSEIQIGLLVTGDGFPNTEAFVVGPNGKAVFLGTHVRQGVAPLTLAANFKHKLFGNVIRLPVNSDGSFVGTVEDDGAAFVNKLQKSKVFSITDWNNKFLNSNPNAGRCMALEDIRQIVRIHECF